MEKKITIDDIIPDNILDWADADINPILSISEYACEKYGDERAEHGLRAFDAISDKQYKELDKEINNALKTVTKNWLIKHHLEPDF